MSGAVLDGVRTHHSGVNPDMPAATTLAHLIDNLVTGPPTTTALQHLHDVAADQDPLPIADAVTSELTGRNLPAEHLRQIGRWLSEYGTRRNAVALGILLLGLAGDHRDRDLLLLLGSLEDLSLYAAVALTRSQPDRDQALFDLAARVAGWGRIQTVRRLAGTQDPQIKAWLLRHGFRNRIMDEYLAHLAATTGDLLSALTTPPVDDELLDGAGDILAALCLGGPAKDITDYPAAPETIDQYLTLVTQRPPSLTRVDVVLRLARFLTSDQAVSLNWTDTHRARMRRTCDRLVEQSDWLLAVDHAMDSPDLPQFRLAIWPARQLGIPTRTRIRARVHQHPDDGYLWQALTDDIDDVLVLAHQLLPLDHLANGPTLDVGLRADQPHHILDLIVSRLDAHPGKGWSLIRIALANPTIRNRNMAIRALTAWPPDTIADHVVAALQHASMIEPDPSVRGRMRQLLATWTTQGERHAAE
ncbi:hypothetical protein GCM10022251_75190 [Phytohabitans flavus]|uniref:Uncharacterized protein n=1 Tax=Phytohabitans flavus TaxID=1076124 RepID=A0A6F8XLE0_9ACTN|nr:hypothetical protein [Phytohabitans flavus]BCB74623.1 hypothetical protein Pflav_010330 [Phytohabitans flavus]